MKRFFTRFFQETLRKIGGHHDAPSDTPKAGQIYSFRTAPYSEFAQPMTDRYAAFKIIEANERYVTVAVLDGIWPAAPTLREARARSIVHEHRFAKTGRRAVFGVQREWWTPDDDLQDLAFVGVFRLRPRNDPMQRQ